MVEYIVEAISTLEWPANATAITYLLLCSAFYIEIFLILIFILILLNATPMEPTPEGLSAPTLNTLIDAIQHIAALRRYAVVKTRTKKDKKTDLIRRA